MQVVNGIMSKSKLLTLLLLHINKLSGRQILWNSAGHLGLEIACLYEFPGKSCKSDNLANTEGQVQ